MCITYCTYSTVWINGSSLVWRLLLLILAGFDIIIDLVTLLDDITFSSCQVFFHSRASSLSSLPHSFITPHDGEWEKHYVFSSASPGYIMWAILDHSHLQQLHCTCILQLRSPINKEITTMRKDHLGTQHCMIGALWLYTHFTSELYLYNY